MASRELNVRQVLAKVVLGEADAGVVYRSDAIAAAGKVAVVGIPPELNVIAEYPIAALKAAPHPDLARRWIDLREVARGRGGAARGGVHGLSDAGDRDGAGARLARIAARRRCAWPAGARPAVRRAPAAGAAADRGPAVHVVARASCCAASATRWSDRRSG